MIEISVLGPLEVRTPDRGVVPLASPLQRALLVRLVIEPGRVVSVDRLVEDLWGEKPPSDPADALRYHVWRLRDALDPERPTRSQGRYLRTKSPGYRFDPGDAWIDVAEFDRLRAAGRAGSSVATPRRSARRSRRARGRASTVEPDTAGSSAVAAQRTSSSTSSADRSGDPGQATDDETPAVSDPAFDSTQAWAAGRYERAGLTIPDALVHVHDDRAPCEGRAAILVGTEPTPEIHLCFRR